MICCIYAAAARGRRTNFLAARRSLKGQRPAALTKHQVRIRRPATPMPVAVLQHQRGEDLVRQKHWTYSASMEQSKETHLQVRSFRVKI
jgi:hypothetical protein